MPVIYNGQQSPLEAAAIIQRNILLPQNIYKVGALGTNEYWDNHTRALSDQTTPHYGRGTGNFLDINNYAVGTDWDILGNPQVAQGSGRNPAFANNAGTWGYDPGHNYQHPNTAGNIGQVII
jgi:hypothetical protein